MENRFIKIVGEVLEIDEKLVTKELSHDDLETWDSLKHLELVGAIEDNFGISIPIEEVSNINNVGDFLKYIK